VTSDERPPGGFGITITFVGDDVVLRLVGDLDLVSAPDLIAVVGGLINGGRVSLLLDLAGVSSMGAAGLGAIALAADRLHSSGGDLAIRSASPLVTRLLDITGLDAVVRVAESEIEHLGPEEAKHGPERSLRSGAVNLIHPLRQVAAVPADDDVVDGALRLVVALARATVGGADGVSVSLRRHGRLATVASSNQTILDMDADQYATGEGPCVDASVEGRWFHIESLDNESRWPAFVPRAKELGINAILSSPLMAQQRPVGALNIYSRTAAAFAVKDQELAAIFASEASMILEDAGAAVSDGELSARLQEAMESREVITLARGVMMERDALSAERAFASLLRSSRQTSKPLRELAAEIVASVSVFSTGWFEHDERGDG
jgi:anti-anti-sigma factor